MKTFHDRLTSLINDHDDSQKHISSVLGIAASTMVRYKDDRVPRAEELLKLARYFNVTMEWLLCGDSQHGLNSMVHDEETQYSYAPKHRQVPVIGWAHAGDPVNYEESADKWDHMVPTECRDPRAFAVKIRGESMQPSYLEDDTLIIMPSEEAYSGILVICRFNDTDKNNSGGVLFRRMEIEADNVILIPENPRYPVTHHKKKDFEWIYPVWGRWTQLWK